MLYNQLISTCTLLERECQVSYFKLTEAICSPVQLSVLVRVPNGWSPESCVNQPIRLIWHVAGSIKREMTLTVFTCRVSYSTATHQVFEITAASRWAALEQAMSARRVYCHATLRAVIASVMERHGMPAHLKQYQLSGAERVYPHICQINETDGEFLARIVGRADWQWVSRFEEGQERLVFIDGAQGLVQWEEPLVLIPSNVHRDAPASRQGIFSFHRHIHAHPRHATCEFASYYGACEPHTLINIQGIHYRVETVVHQGTETALQDGMIYHNNVTAAEHTAQWRGVSRANPTIPTVFDATVVNLNDTGKQQATLLGDTTIPIARLTPSVCEGGGMSFPLQDNMQVMLTCLDGEPDTPIIIGASYDKKHHNPVSDVNPWHNILKTPKSQTLLFDDTPEEPLLMLQTERDHTFILANGDEPGIYVRCTGGMIWQSKLDMQVVSGKGFLHMIEGGLHQQAGTAHHLTAHTYDIALGASQSMQTETMASIVRHVGTRFHQITGEALFEIEESSDIRVMQGSVVQRVQGEDIIACEESMTFESTSGNIEIQMQNGAGRIILMQNGTIRIEAHSATMPQATMSYNGKLYHHSQATRLPFINPFVCDTLTHGAQSDIMGCCTYYHWRNNNFLQRHVSCEHTPPDYYLNYGAKYCERFANETKAKLSKEGKLWVEKAKLNLQIAMEKFIENDKANIELNSIKFREAAFRSHPKAYLDAGLEKLPSSDLFQIMGTPDFIEWLDPETRGQAYETMGGHVKKHGIGYMFFADFYKGK